MSRKKRIGIVGAAIIGAFMLLWLASRQRAPTADEVRIAVSELTDSGMKWPSVYLQALHCECGYYQRWDGDSQIFIGPRVSIDKIVVDSIGEKTLVIPRGISEKDSVGPYFHERVDTGEFWPVQCTVFATCEKPLGDSVYVYAAPKSYKMQDAFVLYRSDGKWTAVAKPTMRNYGIY